MKKRSILVSSVLSFGAFSALAQSTAPAPAPAPAPEPSPFTANVNLTTKYKFRGQDQGNTAWASPALQGGFDWSQNGFYLGNWNSNVSFSNAAIEMDFYAGYKGEITKDFGYDVGILQYYYPQKDKVVNFNTTELYGALTWQFLTVKYSHTISNDYFGIGATQQIVASADGASISRPKGQNTGYIEANANFPLMDKLTLNGHIGYTNLASGLRNASYTAVAGEGGTTNVNIGTPSFADFKLGLTYDLGSGFSAAGAVVGANRKEFYGDINKTQVILTLSKTM